MADVFTDGLVEKDKRRAGRRYLKRLARARRKSISVMVDLRLFKTEKEARDRLRAKRQLKPKRR